jgi:hypothetical protein
MSEITSLDEAMSSAAQSGVEFVQQHFGLKLDRSEASIEIVESVLGKIYDSIPKGFFARLIKKSPSPQELERIGMMMGGYIAEVIKGRWGGKWKTESSVFPGQQVLTFETAGIDMWPQFKVGKRLTNGPEDSVWHYFQVFRKQLQGAV